MTHAGENSFGYIINESRRRLLPVRVLSRRITPLYEIQEESTVVNTIYTSSILNTLNTIIQHF